MNEREIELAAICHYGTEAQISKTIEEASELIRALCRYQQKGIECSEDEILNIVEEIADVQIMCDQMEMVILGGTAVKEMKKKKLSRLVMRMEEEKRNGN